MKTNKLEEIDEFMSRIVSQKENFSHLLDETEKNTTNEILKELAKNIPYMLKDYPSETLPFSYMKYLLNLLLNDDHINMQIGGASLLLQLEKHGALKILEKEDEENLKKLKPKIKKIDSLIKEIILYPDDIDKIIKKYKKKDSNDIMLKVYSMLDQRCLKNYGDDNFYEILLDISAELQFYHYKDFLEKYIGSRIFEIFKEEASKF